MENNEREILVLYYDKATKSYHPVLLNSIEEGAICAKITEIFAAKGYDFVFENIVMPFDLDSVMVDERKYKLFREENKSNVKENNSGSIQ